MPVRVHQQRHCQRIMLLQQGRQVQSLLIGQNVDFSSIIPQGSVIRSITIYCPTGTRVTQSKYTTINNYLISSYETGTTATVSFKQTNSPSSTSKTTAFQEEAARC